MSEAAELLGPGLRPQPLEGEEKNGQARKGSKSLVRMTQCGMGLEGTLFL